MSEQIGNVWVFIEQEGGKIADVSLELVSKGAELASTLGVDVEAVLLGSNVEKVLIGWRGRVLERYASGRVRRDR